MPYDFLSDEWMDAMDSLRDEAPEPSPVTRDLVINLEVTDAPFGSRQAHMAGGRLERGLHEAATTKLTVPYEVAKSLFVAGDQQAAMQAFMSGRIKVEGDMTKLMAMGSAGAPTEDELAFQERVRGLTA